MKITKNSLMRNSIDIQIAEDKDLNLILNVLDEAAKWLNSIGIKDQWIPGEFWKANKYYKKSINSKHIYIAKINSKIAGTFLVRWSDKYIWGKDNNNAGYIHHLAINREFTGQGLGDILLEWAERKIKNEGKKYIRLDCIDSNIRLNEYYLKRGYKLKRQIKYDDGEIGNLYEKVV